MRGLIRCFRSRSCNRKKLVAQRRNRERTLLLIIRGLSAQSVPRCTGGRGKKKSMRCARYPLRDSSLHSLLTWASPCVRGRSCAVHRVRAPLRDSPLNPLPVCAPRCTGGRGFRFPAPKNMPLARFCRKAAGASSPFIKDQRKKKPNGFFLLWYPLRDSNPGHPD